MKLGYSVVLFSLLGVLPCLWASGQLVDAAPMAPGVVKRAEINPAVPVFIPVHPRIATTITFPKPIGEPVGTGFIDADALQKAAAEGKNVRGEYAITFQQGDPFFTVQPLPKSDLLNLNVPYEGSTLVLYFYAVEKPLSAIASLTFVEKSSAASPSSTGSNPQRATAEPDVQSIKRVETLPTVNTFAATPARLDGFLRKLKLVHAARLGSELDDVAEAMKLKVAVTSVENPEAAEVSQPVNRNALFELILLRAVRDPALDAMGFIVLFRNTSDQSLVLDVRTLSARCGAALYTAQVVDAPATLNPGELKPGYFAIVGSGDGRPGYLSPHNDWKLSVALVSPMATSAGQAPGEKMEAAP